MVVVGPEAVNIMLLVKPFKYPQYTSCWRDGGYKRLLVVSHVEGEFLIPGSNALDRLFNMTLCSAPPIKAWRQIYRTSLNKDLW